MLGLKLTHVRKRGRSFIVYPKRNAHGICNADIGLHWYVGTKRDKLTHNPASKNIAKLYSAYHYFMDWPSTITNDLYFRFDYENKVNYKYSQNHQKIYK